LLTDRQTNTQSDKNITSLAEVISTNELSADRNPAESGLRFNTVYSFVSLALWSTL